MRVVNVALVIGTLLTVVNFAFNAYYHYTLYLEDEKRLQPVLWNHARQCSEAGAFLRPMINEECNRVAADAAMTPHMRALHRLNDKFSLRQLLPSWKMSWENLSNIGFLGSFIYSSFFIVWNIFSYMVVKH